MIPNCALGTISAFQHNAVQNLVHQINDNSNCLLTNNNKQSESPL